MTHRPIIGIATQTLEAIPGELPPCWIMGQSYVHALRSVGAIPWIIPLLAEDTDTLREIFDRLDGVFFTGGVDVDPSKYGEAKQSFCGRTDLPRDEVEIQLTRWAMEAKKPILAVCRGIQVMNVALGGTLFQDVAQQVPGALKHDYFPTKDNPSRNRMVHTIDVRGGTRLATMLGDSRPTVNSMHHQAIKDLAPCLMPSATAPDGVIEAVEGLNGQFVVGVQWHPEEMAATDAGQKRLFSSFIAAAERR